MLREGTYKAIAIEDLELPDNPNIFWNEGYSYEAIIDKTGTMCLASETGQSYYTANAVDKMKSVFNFEESL